MYTYTKTDDYFTILNDGEVLLTPRGAVVRTKSEELAKLLANDANKDKRYFHSLDSVLCYHQGICDVMELISPEEREKGIIEYCEDIIYSWDNFLLFRQPAPNRAAYAQYFAERVPKAILNAPLHRQAVFLNFAGSMNSVMLPYYIASDIIMAEGDYEENKKSFIDDMEEFYMSSGDKFTKKTRAFYNRMIDTIQFYWNLDMDEVYPSL